MTVYAILIINKSGSLMYYKGFSGSADITVNDRLRWASTFHSLHAISTQFAPTCGSEGIEYVEASTFCMHCLKTPTGLKFVCVGSKESKNLPEFLDQVYVCYCDYLMKNPFYEPESPINYKTFDDRISLMARTY